MARILKRDGIIANGQTTSGQISVPDGHELCGIYAPVCTGTALTITASKTNGGTFMPVHNAADQAISHTISGTAHYIALDSALYRGLEWIKLVSGSSEGAARTFTCVFVRMV